MGSLGMPFENLPLGFRFKPTDVELIDHYLRLKINGKDDEVACITEVDICRVEPWDLPDLSAIKTNDHEWFFFCPRDRKYPNGQRSNRATGAGYWKATGKDRTIKSRKLGLIGMKKTLVFYTGRAPKGQRTHWVIHEYRTTLQEIDGTNPGQEAFVLCRLFKKADEVKHDDNEDCSHTEDIETTAGSPMANSHEGISSSPAVVQASPGVTQHTLEHSNCVVKTSDSMTSETVWPDHSHNNSYGRPCGESKMNEEMTPEVVSHLNDVVEHDYDPSEPFPLMDQMQDNNGPLGMEPLPTTNIGDVHTGLQLQGVKGRDPIVDFLDSVIIDPDDYLGDESVCQGDPFLGGDTWKNMDNAWWNNVPIKESGSSSGSDVDVAQVQQDVGFTGCINSDTYGNEPRGNVHHVQTPSLVDDDDIFSDAALDRFCNLPNIAEPMYLPQASCKAVDNTHHVSTGIKIRTHKPRRMQVQPPTFVGQGTANRRMRLQVSPPRSSGGAREKESEETTVTERSCLSAEFGEGGFADTDSPSTVAPHEEYFCVDEFLEKAAEPEEKGTTGIKIRINPRRSQPTAPSLVSQGTAHRRIRLQKPLKVRFSEDKDDEAKLGVVEVSEKVSAHKSDGEPGHKCVLSHPVRWRLASPVYTVTVILVVFLFVVFLALWKARNLVLVSG